MVDFQEVLDFWFKESGPSQWFKKDKAFDQKISERFEETYEQAVRGETALWRDTYQGRLAEVLVLDQFPRNMFRNSPRAFAADSLALKLAQEAVSMDADKMLPRRMRHFLYMPFMHSESPQVHKKAPWLFLKSLNFDALRYEFKHKRIIDRFGRYPHRNEVLGRQSTPEEAEFLKTHSGF
jgi:uncharacterized protein (DUF924 family)